MRYIDEETFAFFQSGERRRGKNTPWNQNMISEAGRMKPGMI